MKKGMAKKSLRGVLIIPILLIILFSLVLAAHTITLIAGSSINEDTSSLFNISVNNTDTSAEANITQVEIVLPSNFTFTGGTNSTSVGTHTFSNTTTVLTWSNSDGLVMNLTMQYFWFNANATTPGNYNITVNTTNSSGVTSNNVAVTVNDTTDPSSIIFRSPTESNYANISRTNIVVNVTAADNGAIGTIIIRLYNSTRGQINTSSSSTSPNYINWTLSPGVYYFNATVNDTFGNSNDSATLKVTIDTTYPLITLVSPSDGTSGSDTSYNFTFNVSDNVGIASCEVIVDGTSESTSTNISNGTTNGIVTSLGTGEHAWYIRCTDYASNQNSSGNRTVTVTNSSDDDGGGGGSGSNDQVYYPGTDTLALGYTKDYGVNWKMKFSIENITHTMNLDSLNYSAGSATITISSTPQTKTLSLQNNSFEWKIDVDGDGEYYDLKLILSKVTSIRATITAQTINELIPEDERVVSSSNSDEDNETQENQTTNGASTDEDSENSSSGKEGGLRWYWHVLIIFTILAIIAGVAFWIIKRSQMNKKVFGN